MLELECKKIHVYIYGRIPKYDWTLSELGSNYGFTIPDYNVFLYYIIDVKVNYKKLLNIRIAGVRIKLVSDYRVQIVYHISENFDIWFYFKLKCYS